MTRLKEALKLVPGLRPLKWAMWALAARVIAGTRDRRHIFVLNNLRLFAPSSSGSPKDRAALTILAANQIFPFLAALVGDVGEAPALSLVKATDFCDDEESRRAAEALKALFASHGSDKASSHDYHLVYGKILKTPSAVSGLLEIGLGTNHTDVVSSMGASGRPGASLRAFRDYLPNARVYGADIDKRVLFEEERISTFYVDQTAPDTFAGLGAAVGHGLDLIIDDGLHAPNANVSVLSFALRRLKPGGWVVIEDIAREAQPMWAVIPALLPAGYAPYLIEDRTHLVFAARKPL